MLSKPDIFEQTYEKADSENLAFIMPWKVRLDHENSKRNIKTVLGR